MTKQEFSSNVSSIESIKYNLLRHRRAKRQTDPMQSKFCCGLALISGYGGGIWTLETTFEYPLSLELEFTAVVA
jgi:hypothetical protein